MPPSCPLTFPPHWSQDPKDTFCALWTSRIYVPEKPYEIVKGAVKSVADRFVPLAYHMDLEKYRYHPTEVYAKGQFVGTIEQFTQGQMIAVKRVESVGNGDQGLTAEQAQYGNLYLVTRAGNCQDRSFRQFAWRNFRDFPNRNTFLDYLTAFNRYEFSTETRFLDEFPNTVADSKQDLPAAIVTVLPGPFGTHAPNDPESIKKGYTMKQGEFALAWQSVSYYMGGTPTGKPSIPKGDPKLPTELRTAKRFCSKVIQSHGRPDEILRFAWSPEEAMTAGGLTVAHDNINDRAVLRGEAARTTPSRLKLTLATMSAPPPPSQK